MINELAVFASGSERERDRERRAVVAARIRAEKAKTRRGEIRRSSGGEEGRGEIASHTAVSQPLSVHHTLASQSLRTPLNKETKKQFHNSIHRREFHCVAQIEEKTNLLAWHQCIRFLKNSFSADVGEVQDTVGWRTSAANNNKKIMVCVEPEKEKEKPCRQTQDWNIFFGTPCYTSDKKT